MQETWVQSLGQEDLLERKMATRSSILDWKITRLEEPGGLQFMGSQRDGYNFVTKQQQSEDLLYSTGNSMQHCNNPSR